jgi:hypothetical protein
MDRRKLNIHIKILFYLIVKGKSIWGSGKQKAESKKLL